PFGTVASATTEVLPADYLKEDHSFPVYDIPDCDGTWMHASPDAHNAYVRMVDNKLGGKVKPLIRFIKAWKYLRSVPISSFYLELRVAHYAYKEKSIVYDIDVKRVLCMLRDCSLASMRDPMGISGLISPCKTSVILSDALSKLNTAATRAEKARDAEAAKKTSEAFAWWRLLYDDHFPTYYRG
ncbi:MAG: nucleotidyltransferase, partial [Alphaproteobacteria bacterium]